MPTEMIRLRRPRRTGIWFSASATGGRNPALLHEIFEQVGQHTSASLPTECIWPGATIPGVCPRGSGLAGWSAQVLTEFFAAGPKLPAVFLRLGGHAYSRIAWSNSTNSADHKKGSHWAYPTTQINVSAATAIMAIFVIVIGMLMTTVLNSQPWQRC